MTLYGDWMVKTAVSGLGRPRNVGKYKGFGKLRFSLILLYLIGFWAWWVDRENTKVDFDFSVQNAKMDAKWQLGF